MESGGERGGNGWGAEGGGWVEGLDGDGWRGVRSVVLVVVVGV